MHPWEQAPGREESSPGGLHNSPSEGKGLFPSWETPASGAPGAALGAQFPSCPVPPPRPYLERWLRPSGTRLAGGWSAAGSFRLAESQRRWVKRAPLAALWSRDESKPYDKMAAPSC